MNKFILIIFLILFSNIGFSQDNAQDILITPFENKSDAELAHLQTLPMPIINIG